MTAAHCNDESRNANSVYVGTVRRRQGGVRRTIMDKVAHPDFDTSNVRNYDFMILKLDSSALVDENGQKTGVEPIALNYDRFVPAEGDPLLAVGYGTTQEGDKGMSSELRDVQIEAFSEDTCRRQYSSYFQEDIMFCAGVEGGVSCKIV